MLASDLRLNVLIARARWSPNQSALTSQPVADDRHNNRSGSRFRRCANDSSRDCTVEAP